MSTDSAPHEPQPQQAHEPLAQTEPPAPATAPAQQAPAAPAAQAAQAESGGRPPARTGPRTGPIVWGALILAFCGYAAQRVFSPGGLDTAWWITATVIGLGLLLLAVGVAVAVRNRG